jgi:hypothetical protein
VERGADVKHVGRELLAAPIVEQAGTCGAVGFWGCRNTRYECDKPKNHAEKLHENSSEEPSVIWFGDHAGPSYAVEKEQ